MTMRVPDEQIRLKLPPEKSIAEWAKELGISKHKLYRLTNTGTSSISLTDLAKLSQRFKVDIPFLERKKGE